VSAHGLQESIKANVVNVNEASRRNLTLFIYSNSNTHRAVALSEVETAIESEITVLLHLTKGAGSRKKILRALLHGFKNRNQIAKEIDLNWRTTDQHLNILIKENMVKKMDFGQRAFFKLTPKVKKLLKILKKITRVEERCRIQKERTT
jgi:predicted transcriptional regulator